MSFRTMPYWLKGGCMAGIIGPIVVFALPGDISDLATTPWWAAWFILPAFVLFSATCVLFGVDFISNTHSQGHLVLLNALWILSLIETWFIIGAVAGLLIGIVKARKVRIRGRTEVP